MREAHGSLNMNTGIEDTFKRGAAQQDDPATRTLKDMQQKQIDQMQQMSSQRAKADFKPEVFFIG